MPTEIERKFLVNNDQYKDISKPVLFRQGYLSLDPERIVRVRSCEGQGFLTIKGKTLSFSREEYEYPIAVADANNMLDNLCIQPIIEKVRYFCSYQGFEWVIDEFLGENAGLVVAEIELEDEAQSFEKPDWIGREVTSDPSYSNSNLIKKPYRLIVKDI